MSTGASHEPVEVKLGGVVYRLRPLRVQDHDELMAWVQDRVVDVARIAAKGLESQERLALLERAVDKAALLTLDSPETLRLLGSLQGAVKMLWMGLRAEHPELDEATILNQLTDPQTLVDTMAAMREANERANRKPGDRPGDEPAAGVPAGG